VSNWGKGTDTQKEAKMVIEGKQWETAVFSSLQKTCCKYITTKLIPKSNCLYRNMNIQQKMRTKLQRGSD